MESVGLGFVLAIAIGVLMTVLNAFWALIWLVGHLFEEKFLKKKSENNLHRQISLLRKDNRKR